MARALSRGLQRRGRPAGHASALIASISLLAFCRRLGLAGPRSPGRSFAAAAGDGRTSSVRLRAAGEASADDAEATWKSAYEVELERNTVLRDQLQEANPQASEDEGQPEECTLDWERDFARLRACNSALEDVLRAAEAGLGAGPPRPELSEEELDARLPVELAVRLEGRTTRIEVFRRHGAGSSFHNVDASLPLGLNVTLREGGELRGSFVVEDVLPGGFGEASGQILAGDVVQALTTRVTSMGVTTFDSGVTQSTQHLVDTSYLSSVKELVEAITSNVNGDIVLVLERPAATSAQGHP